MDYGNQPSTIHPQPVQTLNQSAVQNSDISGLLSEPLSGSSNRLLDPVEHKQSLQSRDTIGERTGRFQFEEGGNRLLNPQSDPLAVPVIADQLPLSSQIRMHIERSRSKHGS